MTDNFRYFEPQYDYSSFISVQLYKPVESRAKFKCPSHPSNILNVFGRKADVWITFSSLFPFPLAKKLNKTQRKSHICFSKTPHYLYHLYLPPHPHCKFLHSQSHQTVQLKLDTFTKLKKDNTLEFKIILVLSTYFKSLRWS